MIYQNIKFHNVEELVPRDGGMAMSRLPAHLRELMAQRGKEEVAFFSSGVELRFRIKSGEACIYLRMPDVTEGLPAQLMFGAFQGGWPVSVKAVGSDTTCIKLSNTPNIDELMRITREHHLPYDPHMIRILLPYGKCLFMGAEGDIEPPHPGDEPEMRMLSYGSSITHGSLALGSLQCYASRLAGYLGCDSINLGLAGACHLEPEFAEYIMQRKDWNICTVEMGINMLGFEEDAFRERVRAFADVLSRETRPVFTTGIFHYNGAPGRGPCFRKILLEETAGKLRHIDGLQLLNDPTMISEDMVHPSLHAHEQIAARWAEIIRNGLNA